MDPVTGAIAGKAIEQGLKLGLREIGHVVHSNQNIKNLEDGVQILRAQMETVQGRVNRALDNAKVIELHVRKWLSDAGKLLSQMNQFPAADGGREGGASIFKRRRLGKEAEDKLTDVLKLIERGKFDSVGHRPPLDDIRLSNSTADYYQGFESRAAVFNEILEALGDDNVYTIGIYGMAGIGKTTMARDVAKRAKDENSFDKIVQASISQNPDLRKVQGELADFLGLKLDPESLAGRASLLCARFKQKRQDKGQEKWEKILVILDDVWGQINIEEVGIPLNDYVKGCKIVVTSRTRGVLIGEGVRVEKECQLGVLTDTEAWSLFENKVGNTLDSHHHELRSVAEEVCRECGGLPLAIVTLGAALIGKKPHQWIDALNQLKSCTAEYIDGVTAKVYLPIKLSYKFLQHRDTKACFLYCCLYPEDAEISIEELVRYGVGARFFRNRDKMEAARARVSTIVDGLKASCLLLEGRDENFVKMHDIIRDVAISIASKHKKLKLLIKTGVQKWPDEEALRQCRTLPLMLEKDEVLPDQLECPKLRTLFLACSCRNSVGGLDGLFETTKKLEVLSLHNLILSPTIESSISDLANLRMLCLHGCKLENVGFVGKLKKLEILSLNGSMIEALSPEVRKLSHLKVLDFRRCDYFHEISPGIISSLSDLEELYASDMSYETNFDKWDKEGNASIGELNSLQHLTNLEASIPAEAWSSQDLQRVTSLTRFKICIGSHFGEKENHTVTRTLKLNGIELIGGAKVLMKKAEALYLNYPKGLQKLLCHMDEEWFLDLKFLKINNCQDEMEHLLGKPKRNIIGPSPNPIPSPLGKLSILRVSDCRFKSLFSSSVLRCLRQLQELDVSFCESMVEIVGDDEQVGDEVLIFPQLKRIYLLDLPNLRSFYANTAAQALFSRKVSFPVLETLLIENLESITAIWDCQFNLQGADSFQLSKDFVVWGCQKLVNVVTFQLVSCSSLASIVEVVNIAKGFEIQPEAQQADDNDETVVFPKLEYIRFESLPNLKSFCNNFGSRKKERVEDQLLQIEPLFNHKVSFPVLHDLIIEHLQSITAIWDHQWKAQDSFEQLSKLIVSGCDKLEHLFDPHVLPFSQSLKTFEVFGCDSMKFLFGKGCKANDEILVFTRLEHVKLSYLPNLRSFCHTCNFNSHMEDMSRVQALFTCKVSFPVLHDLIIEHLQSITAIWDHQWKAQDSLQQLSTLTVRGCSKLEHLFDPHVPPFSQSLKTLEVFECDSMKFLFGKGCKANDEILVFTRLEQVELSYLPSLRRFCHTCNFNSHVEDMPRVQALFTREVSLPVLHDLIILHLESITAIWDYQWKAQDSFEQLSQLMVSGCDKLEHLVASHVLPFSQSLETLRVHECKSMKFLFGKDCKANDESLVFTQLERVRLANLSSLKSFCYTCTFNSHMEVMPPMQALFTHEVKLPCLKQLVIESTPSLKGIWDITVPTDSICKLKRLTVINCNELLHVAPSKLLKSFHEVQYLRVMECNLLEDIFGVEASSSTEEIAPVEMKNNLLLPQLKSVSLFNLPSLTSFYARSCISKLMPSSVLLEIKNCPELEKELAMHTGDDKEQ